MLYSLEQWQSDLIKSSNNEKVAVLKGFFKTGKGEYGEGDEFIGVTVPENRKIAKKAITLDFSDYAFMLQSSVHEFRLSALIALVERYKKADASSKAVIHEFYLSQMSRINNWDLVDLSAPYIVGEQAYVTGDYSAIRLLSESEEMWERRIAVVSNLSLIRKGKIGLAIEVVEKLLFNEESLMHKANGWILREVGKKDNDALIVFLDKYCGTMPRTTLRYSLERQSADKRAYYMSQKSKLSNNR